jgi:uncharacterized protein
MDMNAVVWFEIYVKDMPRAKTFYEGVFGKKLEKLGDPGPGVSEMWAFSGKPNNAGATGALVKMDDGPSGMEASSSISHARIALLSVPASPRMEARS